MTEEIPPEYFTDDGFKYVYPLAKCIGWTDEQIKEAFNEYNKIEIDGSRAGTSLRMIISDLYKLSSDAALIINKYNIPYDQINPEKNDLLSILITFDECKVPSVDIFYLRRREDPFL